MGLRSRFVIGCEQADGSPGRHVGRHIDRQPELASGCVNVIYLNKRRAAMNLALAGSSHISRIKIYSTLRTPQPAVCCKRVLNTYTVQCLSFLVDRC